MSTYRFGDMKTQKSHSFSFKPYPAIRLAILFITGIVAWKLIPMATMPVLFLVGLSLTLWLFFEILSSKSFNPLYSKLSTVIFFGFVIIAGYGRSWIQSESKESISKQLIAVSEWEEVQLRGQVFALAKTTSGKTRVDLKTEQITYLNGLQISESLLLRMFWEANQPIALGDEILVNATLFPPPEKRNPLEFNYGDFLKSQNISAQARIDEVLEVSPLQKKLSWLWLRKHALKLVENNFDAEVAPIAKALLLGYKSDLETVSRTAFARAGLSHIMAVSGLHVGFIVAPFWILIPYFWAKKYGSVSGIILLALILFLYAGITGFSPSVLRASVMALLLTYGKLFSKGSNSINLTGVAALFILLINPNQLFEIGFQLSFSAVLIILLTLPIIQLKLPYWVRLKWYGAPIMVVIISIVVQLGMLPLQVFYFKELSVISPLANALFVPFLGIVVPLALIGLLLSAMSSFLGGIITFLPNVFLQLLNNFVIYAGSLSWAWVSANLESLLFFPVWMAGIGVIASLRNPHLRFKWVAVFLIMIGLMNTQKIIQALEPAELEVIIFDVGQGDAALIKTPNQMHILIDAGMWTPGTNSGKTILLPHLKAAGISKLDAVILSHPHADHIGGILDLLKGVEISRIYNSGYEYDSNLYRNYIQLASELNVPVISVKAGDSLALDKSMLFLVKGPFDEPFGSDPNENSVIINIIYGESEFLFTGDAGAHKERKLVQRYGDLLNTDFLKVGHHGSKTSSELFFLEKVTPQISTISLAERNKFKHPHPEAIQRIKSSGTEIYYTSKDKALVFRSDGEIIKRIIWDN